MVRRFVEVSLVLLALLACKKEAPPAPVVETAPPPAAPPPEPPPVEKVENFAGTYITNYGKAKCTQVRKNVNCLYQGKSGSLDCKVENENEIACDWDDSAGTGRARLKKQPDGKLVGTWGWKSSEKNGGAWTFKPTDE